MNYLKILNQKLEGRVKENEPLASFTTYKIGGPARYYFQASNKNDLKNAVLVVKTLNLPFFILARGSNVLISDKGFSGLVIHNKSHKYQIEDGDIIADSGVNLSQLANFAVENSLAGLEFAAGIPGSLGGAIRGNAGAWGTEIKNLVSNVTVITEKGEVKKRNNKECNFRYRDSIFKYNKEVIISARLHLEKGKKEKIRQKIKEVVTKKQNKQEFNLPSAGCVFKNPVVNLSKSELEARGIDIRVVKSKGEIPAAYLIEEAGLKGYRVGDAVVSDIHANFIVNVGKATAENVIILIGIVKQKVRNKFKIQLQEEIQYIGFDN